MTYLRSALFLLFFFILTLAMGILFLPLLAAPRKICVAMARAWCRATLWGLKIICGTGMRVTGEIPKGGVLVASKHMSMWDTLALYIVLDDPGIVLKRELLRIPFYGWYLGKAAAIPIDRTRVKPIVKITGEFWAQTTEGDGNCNMFRFLEKEGAQVVVEPIGTWICYLMHQVVQKYRDQKGLDEGAAPPPAWRVDTHVKINLAMRKKILQIKIAENIFKREYNRIIDALGAVSH